MAEELGKIADQARLQFIARMQNMQSFVAMFQNVNPNLQPEIKEEVDPWSTRKTHNADSEVRNSLKDDMMDTLSPTDTDYQSDCSKHSPLEASSTENLSGLTVPKDSNVQTTLACSIPIESSQHSPDINSASQTPSSVNSSPVHSSENSHLEDMKDLGSTNGETQSRLLDVCKSEPSPSSHTYQNLKIEITEGVIAANASFRSFDEFERIFNLWKATYLHPFRVASSEQLRNADGTVDEVFKYKYIVYHCAHYGKPRMRGSGKRPNQNYLPCGCKAMLRLNYAYNTGLRITTLNDKHYGHEITPENYAKSCSKIRRFSPKTPSTEKKPLVWRRQQQNSIRESKYESTNNNTVLSHIQDNKAEKNPNESVDTDTTAYDSSMSTLARSAAQIGKTSAQQTAYQPCQPQNTNGLQNLAAVAAAVGHQQQQQQQQVAAALLSHHKENMGFAFPNLAVMQQTQNTTSNPSLLPLIRGALGLPNFGSPLSFSLQNQVSSGQNNSQTEVTTDVQLPAPIPTQPLSNNNLLTAAQPSQQTSAFAQFLGYQQQQYLQQQNLAAAISLAQSLRTPFFNASIVTQNPATPSAQQDAAQMPEASQASNFQALLSNVQPSTPMDLSVTSNGTLSDSTKESDLFIQSLHSLQSQKNQLSPEEYNKKVAVVKQCITHEFPNWSPDDAFSA